MRRPCPIPFGLATRPSIGVRILWVSWVWVHPVCFKGSFDLILIDPRGRYPPGIPSQTQVISRSLPYESHHLFSDGVFEDRLEPPEQCGCISRYDERVITGDIGFIRTVSAANLKESSHGHAGGVRDAACVAEPCSYIQSGSGVSYGRCEG